jgi:hypothetical protein
MNKYDNDPNYEKVEEGVYKDLSTEEVIFILSDEEGEKLSRILNTADHQDEYVLDTADFEYLFNSDLNEL